MNIGIVGIGVVGEAVKFGLEKKRGHTIFSHDIKFKDTTLENVFHNSDIIFVCVSTPAKKDGSCDISNIKDVCEGLNKLAKATNQKKDVVIKSTVAVGTTEIFEKKYKYLKLAICPEFLKENAAIHDFCNQDICVIGTRHKDLYEKVIKIHGNLAKEYIHTTPTNAELVKYFCNVFNSTRIIFSNLFYDLAVSFNADYDTVKSIAIKRSNMIDYYLDCNPNLRGFNGACLPKDTNAILALSKAKKINYKFLQGLLKDNDRLNKKKNGEI